MRIARKEVVPAKVPGLLLFADARDDFVKPFVERRRQAPLRTRDWRKLADGLKRAPARTKDGQIAISVAHQITPT